MTERLSFNLVDEPWVPVSMLDGSNAELSLRELFSRAHEARGFNEPSPLTYVSVARFLLAIAHRAVEGPSTSKDWVEIWRAGQFDAKRFEAYLDRWRHRFDLFDPEYPFAQAPPDAEVGKSGSISRLLLEQSSVSAATLFDHSHDTNPRRATPAEAARALLTAHNYAFAGTGGRFRDATLIRGYSLLLEGESLFHTLALNLVAYNDTEPMGLTRTGDAPWWELEHDPQIGTVFERPLGHTDLLTWRSRLLRLSLDADGSVPGVAYLQRYFLPQSFIADPFLAYAVVQSGENKGQVITRKFSVGKALWRDGHVLLEHNRIDQARPDEPVKRPGIVDWLARITQELEDVGESLEEPTMIAAGIVNSQARVDLWRMERLPLPLDVVRNPRASETVRRAISIAEDVGRALNGAGRTLATGLLTSGNRTPDKADVSKQLTLLRLDERYWPRLELAFHDFLHQLTENDMDESLDVWLETVERTAGAAYQESAYVAAFDAQGMKAAMEGERRLNRGLWHLRQDRDNAEGETPQLQEATTS
jgi:CRISPR system Cascade subunit CasA